jgi:hypothetical protein
MALRFRLLHATCKLIIASQRIDLPLGKSARCAVSVLVKFSEAIEDF